MKRIIIHWTAGAYKSNKTDKEHYHFLIEGDGDITKGKFSPEANLYCTPNEYAAHCLGCNTDSIGVAMCSMKDFYSPMEQGNYPITKIQFESMCRLVASLCLKYKIPISEVYTHMEIDKKVRKLEKYDNRKIDIIYIPCYPKAKNTGDFIRNKVLWYINYTNKPTG